MSNLNSKVKALEAAEAAVEKELARLYPMGWDVRVWLQDGQVTPSRGQVIGHRGTRYAYVLVRLESRTRATRDVPAKMILSCEKPERRAGEATA